jgi:hypothetical protein
MTVSFQLEDYRDGLTDLGYSEVTWPVSSETQPAPPTVKRRRRQGGKRRRRRESGATVLLEDDCDIRAEACLNCRDRCINLVRCCAGRCKTIGRVCDGGNG